MPAQASPHGLRGLGQPLERDLAQLIRREAPAASGRSELLTQPASEAQDLAVLDHRVSKLPGGADPRGSLKAGE